MPELLELAQFPHGDGMTKVQVRGRGVVTGVDLERFPGFFRFNQAFP